MTPHPHRPGPASRRCSAAASSPAYFRETPRGNRLLGANPFSRFSNRFLSLLLESGGILALVAFLPNESYAGRADEVLMGPPPDQPYLSAGVSAPRHLLYRSTQLYRRTRLRGRVASAPNGGGRKMGSREP